ncbi:MAG: bacillithiol biosynthesis deacetylase BshB1 [Waddliaceae bacterium]
MVDILAFGAHPDDIEFGCGGILAKMSKRGASIVLVDLTRGEKGTNGTASIRQKEAEEAAKIIGAPRLFLDFADCELQDNYESRLKIVEVIREYKPKLVLAPDVQYNQNHPDHVACGMMVRAACRFARFSKILPDLPIHRVEGVLHYPNASNDRVDFIVDISQHVEVWKEMIDAHSSQMQTIDYKERTLRIASRLGTLNGCDFAQGLIKENPVIIDDVMTISKGTKEI